MIELAQGRPPLSDAKLRDLACRIVHDEPPTLDDGHCSHNFSDVRSFPVASKSDFPCWPPVNIFGPLLLGSKAQWLHGLCLSDCIVGMLASFHVILLADFGAATGRFELQWQRMCSLPGPLSWWCPATPQRGRGEGKGVISGCGHAFRWATVQNFMATESNLVPAGCKGVRCQVLGERPAAEANRVRAATASFFAASSLCGVPGLPLAACRRPHSHSARLPCQPELLH
jgi:hypothetical protein